MERCYRHFRVLLCLYLLIFGLQSHGAIQIANFSSITNDRFADDPAFVASGLDLSGVAIANDGKWVTMLSPNVFISANHYHPANGTSVTFYTSNDPSGASTTRAINSGQRIGSSDFWIGTLDNPLSGAFASYGFATQDTATYNSGAGPTRFTNSPYYGETAYLLGRSPSSWSTLQDIAVGLNVLDNWADNVTAGGTTDDALIAFVDAEGTGNYVNYEALLQTGDSGAPLFAGDGTIVGLNWFVGTFGADDINGFSYIGNYDAEIQSFIDANPVPEPISYGLVLGNILFLCSWAYRRRSPSTS